MNDSWLEEKFEAGETDSLRDIIEKIPEESAPGLFFRGVFDKNGEEARFYYDQLVALYPGSRFEPWALQRLWHYHWTKGENEKAKRYYNFLVKRHPEHKSVTRLPDFSIKDLAEISKNKDLEGGFDAPEKSSVRGSYWTVQLGAFQNPDGANRIAERAKRWGRGRVFEKTVNGKRLTIVQVGKFDTKEKAVDLERSIRKNSDLKGRAVEVK
ncbi:SPOR domain-containing protein [bacterium]|nr:SPOR domain-containing protein [bacterium]